MKTKLFTFSLLALFILGTPALTSCNKDSDPIAEEQEEAFDINNPEGYFLYYKGGGLHHGIFEFLPGKKVKTRGTGNSDISSYAVADNTGIR